MYFSEASDKEKSNGMAYAHKYVGATDRPLRSISVVNQRRAGFMYKDLEGTSLKLNLAVITTVWFNLNRDN